MKIAALAGGVGGAKLVDGLAAHLSPDELSVIVNTGDDFVCCGLHISPDLDTVCYTLADLANPSTGWGQRDETWMVYETLKSLDGPDWFRLGDRDLATHLFRTQKLNDGYGLTEVTRSLCKSWGVDHRVYPMSDQPVRTIVHTADQGSLGFQNYFVEKACQPVVESFEFQGIEQAQPVPGALAAIEEADLILLAPSNPWVSIDPILAVNGYLAALKHKFVIAVSPLIAGRSLKGPAAKMYRELGIEPCASAVAYHYKDFLNGFVIDHQDHEEFEKIERWHIITLLTNIIMTDEQDRIRFAEEILKFGDEVLSRSH